MITTFPEQISLPSSTPDPPPGSAAVLVNFYAALLGGPLSQLLKCLTAVKVCEEFEKINLSAIPVCLLHRDAPPGFLPKEICLVDRRSKLHCLKSAGNEAGTPEVVITGAGFEKLFEKIEEIFPDGDGDALLALKEALVPGASDTNFVSSCARWLEYLLKDFGVLVMEHGCSTQSRTLPVAAFIADSNEQIDRIKQVENPEWAKTLPQFEHADDFRPFIRPCPDVTISSARNLKTLKRYGIDYTRLFDDKERVMDFVRETLKSDVPVRLRKLRGETCAVLDELKTTVFTARGERSDRIRLSRAARIIYQLEKIQRLSGDALANKEKAAENRISKACDFLAPKGRRQRDALCGAQIPLYYGRTGLQRLYERIDITTPNHQLIEMD